jgi:hypothetical protein
VAASSAILENQLKKKRLRGGLWKMPVRGAVNESQNQNS